MHCSQDPSYDQAAALAQPLTCDHCARPPTICVCDRSPQLQTRHRILILQHPQEQDLLLGSAPLALRCLPSSRCKVGMSWPSLGAALGEAAQPAHWAVLFPLSVKAKAALPPEPDAALRCTDAHGQLRGLRGLRGIIVLDGTWSQAKSLWWRNPWLLKCPRLSLTPAQPSIYGKLRRQPQAHCLSTLEALGEALDGLGEAPEVRLQLRRCFRTFVQRLRDSAVASPAQSLTMPA